MSRPSRLLAPACATLLGAWLASVSPAVAQTVTFSDVSPSQSSSDASDPDGASGGRTNGLAITPGDSDILYGATEWGGIYKSTDRGLTWFRLNNHLPVSTWDVEVDPSNTSRVYATSFYDGRITTLAGINVSTDGGATWTHPATANFPVGPCAFSSTEPAAFGIAIDPANNANVFIGTHCGLARSTDSGATWTFVDPTSPGAGSATRIWDVVAHGGGVIDICGDDGHRRSNDGGTTWLGASTGIASGRCSLAASPDESNVLVAVVGTTIYETDNADNAAGATWQATRTNPSPQGRIPFVATNQRADQAGVNVFDLWFGDVSLHRVTCTTPAIPDPLVRRCGSANSPAWAGPFTRTAGAHDDTGDIVFDREVAIDRCPVLMSSDGGVYRNTLVTSPGCHSPAWEQPNVTPHALWLYAMDGADRAGVDPEDLYFGNQDNGVFGALNASAATPTWTNQICCDGFDTAAEPTGIVYSVCCFGGGGRSTQYFRRGAGFAGGGQFNTYPAGGLPPTFKFPDAIHRFDVNQHVFITRDCSVGSGGCPGADGGVFVTPDINAAPIVWNELGPASEPPTNTSTGVCGVKAGVSGGVPTFYVQAGNCNSQSASDTLWKYVGTGVGSTWTQITLPGGEGFGVVAVHPTDPNKLMASGLTGSGAVVYSSTNGGTNWSPIAQLNTLMTGSGAFKMRTTSHGPTDFTGFGVYWQPSLLAFDPTDNNILVAGGKDSGIFLSTDGGANWGLVSDPLTSGTSGVPHIPRPWYAYFDAESGENKRVYIGSQGRGVWRMTVVPGGGTSLTIDDVTLSEGNAGTTNATFTVTANPTSASPITVQYQTSDGTAAQPGDYQTASGTLTFAASEATRTFTVPVVGDVLDETDETFIVTLSNASGASIGDSQGIGTITDDDNPPTIGINDVSQAEGNAGTTNMGFTASLSAASGKTVTVNYATADGTATTTSSTQGFSNAAAIGITDNAAAVLYPSNIAVSALTGTVTKVTATLTNFNHTFPQDVDVILVGPGGQKVLLMSDAGGDTDAVNLNLTFDDAGPALTSGALGTGTFKPTDINDNEGTDIFPAPAPASPYAPLMSAFNGVNPNGTWSLYVRDDFAGDFGSISGGWTVTITTSGGDYISASGTLTFPPLTTTQPVNVGIVGDTANEANETFFVNLSSPVNTSFGDNQGQGTINNDDTPPLPTLSINDVAVSEGNAGTVNADFTVTLSAVSGSTVTVAYATANGTAIQPGDYGSTSGTLTFTAGQTSKLVTVVVNGDTLDEANETFVVNLSSPSNATLLDGQGQGTINDDDATPSLSIDDVAVTEGNAGTVNANFTVTLSAASGQTVTVTYTTQNGTASSSSDYGFATGTLTFLPSETTKPVVVAVNGDVLDEANETYFVNLTSPGNATLSDNQGLGTINDDDPAPSLSINDVAVAEGNSGTVNASFTVTLTPASGQTVTVPYQTADGSAQAGSDYVAKSGTVTFPPGTTTQPIAVQVNGDLVDEPNETFLVNLSPATNAGISDNQGQGTINDDDDPALTISIDDVVVTEGDPGTTQAVFTISLSRTTTDTVTVSYATAAGTATAGSDFTMVSGTHTFAPGVTTKTVAVPILGDLVKEPDEDYFVNLSSPVNGTLSDGQGRGLIQDDDGRPIMCRSIISVPLVITAQGRYCLVQNVSTAMTSGAAITVNSDFVEIDLKGFKIGGGGAGFGTQTSGVYALNRKNITIKNGNIRGFLRAVFLEDNSGSFTNSQGHLVQNVRADENTLAGIHVQGRGNIVRGNQVVKTTGTTTLGANVDIFGIRSDGPGARVLNNEVTDSIGLGTGRGFAVYTTSATGAVIERNRLGGTSTGAETGIRVISGSNVMVATNRMAIFGTGIDMQGATGKYRANITAGIATPYIGGTDAGNNN